MTLQLSTNVTPSLADGSATWSSSADTVATVDATTGLVTGVATGSVTITATSTIDTTVKATIDLTVVSKLVTVSGPSLATVGETVTLTAKAVNEGVESTTATFTYTSSATDVATVDATGKVTALKVGTSTITVASTGYASADFVITVLADIATVTGYEDKANFETKGVVLDVIDSSNFIVADKIGDKVHIALAYMSSNDVIVGDYVDLVGTFAAAGTYYAELKPTAATKLLAADGFVTPTITAANITASATTGNATFFNGTNTTATIVSVTNAEVTISGTHTNFAIDGFSKGGLTVTSTATVTEGFYSFIGFLYKTGGGYSTVAVYNDALTAVTRPSATGITLTAPGNSTVVRQGETLQLTATQAPFGAKDSITWTSSDTTDTAVADANKVTVSADGLVSAPLTAVIDHEVTITATSAKTSTVTVSMKLKVAAAPSKLTMDVSDTNWPTTAETTATAHTIGGVALMTCGLDKDTSTNAQTGGDIFVKKGAGYLYSSAAISGTIVSIEVTMSSKSSTGAYLGVYTGTSALATRLTTNSITFEKSEVVVFVPTVASSTFFQISNTYSSSNIRFTNIVVKYLAA
jgi:uncharacterized protein YjdB